MTTETDLAPTHIPATIRGCAEGFERQPRLEKNGGVVLIGCRPIKTPIDKNDPWVLAGQNAELVREVGRYLGTPSALLRTLDEATNYLERRVNARLTRDDHRLFLHGMQAICRIMAEAALRAAFPSEDREYISRMGKRFITPQADEESRVVLLKISRGGDTPTHYAREHLGSVLLNDCQILQASSQRTPSKKKGKKPTVVYEIKGKADLSGKILMVFEQAHASAETVARVIPAALKKCKSKPDRIIICCINSCTYAIRRTQRVIPGCIVINACLHNALTDNWYLDDIGCGDCGAEEHLVFD